jgi:NhaP-type Na+/H+ or K+/H+ antiporter
MMRCSLWLLVSTFFNIADALKVVVGRDALVIARDPDQGNAVRASDKNSPTWTEQLGNKRKPVRMMISDVQVSAEESSYNSIVLEVTLTGTNMTDVFCRAFDDTSSPTLIPAADIDFMSCGGKKRCYTGTGQHCVADKGCNVTISGLQNHRKYVMWCVPKFQMEMEEYWPQDSDVFPQDNEGIPWQTERVVPAEVHKMLGIDNFLVAALMVAYIWWSVHGMRPGEPIAHPSVGVVLIGLLAGAILKFWFGEERDFSYTLFSYHLLPMVIFSAGFKLKGNNMTKHFTIVGVLGLAGTLVQFVCLYYCLKSVTNFSARDRLIAASSLCATDTIAAISFVPQATMPLAHSVTLGEGILNDIMAVMVSTTLVQTDAHSLEKINFFKLGASFVYYVSTSLLCGLVFGFIIVQLHRHCAIFKEDFMRSTTMMLMANYSCYAFAECVEVSSILALFSSAVISGRYACRDLPKQNRRLSNDLAEILGTVADSLVYGHFGLTSWSYVQDMGSVWNSMRPVVVLTLTMFALRVATVGSVNASMGWVSTHFQRGTQPLNLHEASLVCISGAMRGTIAYALVLRSVPPAGLRSPSDTAVVSLLNKLVIFNTLVFGLAIPMGVRFICARIKHDADNLCKDKDDDSERSPSQCSH